jgi:hypothetical protein
MVREVKGMMHHSVNEATGNFLREYVSPSIMMLYQLKWKMTAETDAPTYDTIRRESTHDEGH